jgi:hypothetical protein
MGTSTQKAKTPPTKTPANGPQPDSERNDARLLKFLRAQSLRIVTELSFAASQYGLSGRTSEMQESMQIANQIATLTAHWPETRTAATPVPAAASTAMGLTQSATA